MRKSIRRIIAISAITLGGMGAALGLAHAEPAVVPVSRDHYTGTWLEVGRTPMWITDGCVAGYTTYKRGLSADRVMVEDGCRMGGPKGELKTLNGIGTIKDPADGRGKLRVRYAFLITMDYWVRYTAPDRSWFISATPGMDYVWIYARKTPTPRALERMKAKVTELGYDVSKLEFPVTAAP